MMRLEAVAERFAKQSHGDISNIECNGAEFDSRRVKIGQLFFAFPGKQQDGHDHLQQARDRGAVCAVVTRFCSVDIPQILVADSVHAFVELARFYRNTWQGKTVIAVTGSMGKTSSKEMLAALCTQLGPTHATWGNFNNQLGLSWTILNTPVESAYVVLELGISEIGEMRQLSELALPDFAWVTNIAPCHLEGLKSCARIAQEKSMIYRALARGGTAIINTRDTYEDTFCQHSTHCNQLRLFDEHYQLNDDSVRLDNKGCATFSAKFLGESQAIQLGIPGKHQVSNAFGAAVIAHTLGLSLDTIADTLATIGGSPGRTKSYCLPGSQALLIDDSYNANPHAMRSAIETLAAIKKPEKCLIIGDMSELGDASDDWHRSMGEVANQHQLDHVITFGHRAKLALETFTGNGKSFDSKPALVNYVQTLLHKQLVVLIKGSRSCQLEQCVQALTAEVVQGVLNDT